jgi:S-adenosylmethionine:tRNA ribosyltransferase-isomerase
MQLSDFQFDLPDELIARYPTARRTESRLMCLSQGDTFPVHAHFEHVLNLVNPGDLLVFNDTRVIPARLHGHKSTGGQVELLVERVIDRQTILGQVRVSKPPRIGDALYFADGVILEVSGRSAQFYELHYAQDDRHVLEVIESIGKIPLPPYMQREPEASDHERYQTVYAKHKGSVAAPTAGLHFDDALLDALREKGVQLDYLTLHIGAGTFAPVRVEDVKTHKMHPEYLDISPALCEKIKATKAAGKRVIAVGTTSLRALETASQGDDIAPYQGETSIFIYPGYQFRCADVLITNMHLPASTLMMLVCAFGGYERLMNAYREAVSHRYRFYSYGDAMWIARASA